MNKKIILTVIMSVICLSGMSQSLDQARLMYNAGNYAAAKPVFEKLVKQSPNNSSYCQWYGVCCYETNDPENAEIYLLVANKRKVYESYRYLAMLYADTYRYEQSIKMWEEYIDMQRKQRDDVTESETQLEQVRNLLRLQEKTEDVQIIDSVVVNKNAFLEAYRLSEESGSIEPYNKFFKSADNVSSAVFTNQKGNKIYYAHPSEKGFYAIYSQSKLLDAWGDEKCLIADSQFDNNYPFVMSDGVTMYFASKGNGSIGGYDIFVTRYNTNTNTFLAPEQMGMPYNSTADDYMMVIDETKGVGWFASTRKQPEDKVCIYLFIPDPSRRRIDDLTDPEIRVRRATLNSIKDTWKAGADYSALVKLAHTDMTNNEVAIKRDFEFVVNDNTVYYTLDDIKSHEAKDLYSEVISLNKQIETLNKRLDDIRSSFEKGNASTREQLKSVILQAENQLYVLMDKACLQEKKARNAENRILGTVK